MLSALVTASLLLPAHAQAPAQNGGTDTASGKAWFGHVQYLASYDMKGRLTGYVVEPIEIVDVVLSESVELK